MIRDISEPCFWASGILGILSAGYAAVMGAGYWIAASACLCCTGSLGAQRARALGLARSLGESADALRAENARLGETSALLQRENAELKSSVRDLREIAHLLDGTEESLREVEARLRAVLDGVRAENQKHQNNNLLSLFSLVDRDRNLALSEAEVRLLADYVEAVYGKRMDFARLDADRDGRLTLPEFIRLFHE